MQRDTQLQNEGTTQKVELFVRISVVEELRTLETDGVKAELSTVT